MLKQVQHDEEGKGCLPSPELRAAHEGFFPKLMDGEIRGRFARRSGRLNLDCVFLIPATRSCI